MTVKPERRASSEILALEDLEPRDLLWVCLVGEALDEARSDHPVQSENALWKRLVEVGTQSPSHQFNLFIRGTKVRFSSGVLSLVAGDVFPGEGPADTAIGRFEERLTPTVEGGQFTRTTGVACFSFFVDGARPVEFETITAATTSRIQTIDAATGAFHLEISGSVTGSDGVFDNLYGAFTGSSELRLFPCYRLEMRLHFTLGRQVGRHLAGLAQRAASRGRQPLEVPHAGVRELAGPPFARISEALKQTLAPEATPGQGTDRDLDEIVARLASATVEQLIQSTGGGSVPAGAAHDDTSHPGHPGRGVADDDEPTARTRLRNGGTATAYHNGRGTRLPITESLLRAWEGVQAESFFPSPTEVEGEIALARETLLSPVLRHWARRYAAVGDRHLFLWKWCRYGVEATTLSCVGPGLRDEVCDTKVMGIMLNVLFDDIADHPGNDDLLEQLLNLPFGSSLPDFGRQSPEHQEYGELAVAVWNAIRARTLQYPCFEVHADMLRYDYLQLCNSMRYSHLLNGNLTLLNLVEHDLYLPHQMNMMISAAFDLMCSPRFDGAELGMLREALWHAQCMGRIGNLTTTWERELGEGDYTSGVYARAVAHGDLTVADLLGGDRERIRAAIRAGGHEAYFLSRWQEHRQAILGKRTELRSVDVGALVRGLERLICSQLGSRGAL